MGLPILLITWKRPFHTLQVIESLKLIKPNKVFVASDGPNPNNLEEIKLVKETRNILEDKINWKCEVYKKFNSINQGCRLGVTSAIDWFFENVEEGIILEDDCVPHPDFFIFTELLIERYRNDKRIWTISGNNYQDGKWRGDGSYYFSRFPHCWGWATWKDRWFNYSQEKFIFQKLKTAKMLQNIFPLKRDLSFFSSFYEKLYKYNKPDSWAYRWFLVSQAHGGMSVLPNKNLVKNIGFSSNATHTKRGDSPTKLNYTNLECTGILPLKEPSFIMRSIDADTYTFNNYFYPKMHIKIINKFKFLIGILKNFFKP